MPGMRVMPGAGFVLGVFALGVLVAGVVVAGVASVCSVGERLVRLTCGGVSGLAARDGALIALALVPLVAKELVQPGGVDTGRVVGDVYDGPRTVGGHGSHTWLLGEETFQASHFRATEAEVEDDLGDRVAGRPIERVVAVLIRLVPRCHR